MAYNLPDLPYDYSALEPHIDAKTMEIHHTKHHQTYVDKLNGAIEGTDLATKYSNVDDLLRNISSVSDENTKKMVRNHGGHVVPVINRAILRQAADGRKLYFAQEVEIEAAGWIRPAAKLVTACTPLVVFTGRPERVAGELARKDHEDLIRTLAAIKPSALMPEDTLFGRALERTRELSSSGTERARELTEEAREKAKPYAEKAAEKAKEVGDRARRAAKPYVDRARDVAQKAYEEALRLGKELTGHAEPETSPGQE